MITVMYDLIFGTGPGQEKHSEIGLIVHAQAMPVTYRFLSYWYPVASLPVVYALAQGQEMQMIMDVPFQVHQYWRGGSVWPST